MKSITFISTFLFTLLLSFSACDNSFSIKTLDVDDFEQKLHNTMNAQLIDIRTAEEFAEEHIPGAINIDFNKESFEEEILKLDKTKPVFSYCLSGKRCLKASYLFKRNKFSEVYSLEGGIISWRKNGKELVSEK